MEERPKYGAHVLLVPYPSQGHINPMLQFSRRLASKGVKATLAITTYISNTLKPTSDGHIDLATISDGHDHGGFSEAESVPAYVAALKAAGSRSLGALIEEHAKTSHPITCVVYDSFLPWALNVAKKYGLVGAAFFTQACAVNYIYFLIYHKKLIVTPDFSFPVVVPGLPPLEGGDLPSFIGVPGSYPAYCELVLDQCCNLDKADFVLVNTFYELEAKVVDAMSKQCPILTIGPTIPSKYTDNRIEYDQDYNLNLYQLDSKTNTINWLNTKPPKSVIYVSFGSMACLPQEQMEELAFGFKSSDCHFLWVVRASEQNKLPKSFTKEVKEKGLVVQWSPQLEVLASDAIGCFFTHCGWNSTLEGLVFGVAMIGMPQWTDQPMDAKLVQDVWKVGVRVKVDDKGIVRREEIVGCIKEVMEGGEKREELRDNAMRWKDLAKEAISPGGSSDRNIDDFLSKVSSC